MSFPNASVGNPNTTMTTNEIRTKFLDFFKSKGSSIIASDSLVPKDDPTVLFTTAGMQQFKPQFLGHIDGFTKAATCQKCLRTDDLDVVGKTDFHHTFFEMLGNFSFGDYFKKDAIHWAWEFLTGELKLPKEKLWVSVYHEDTEAYGFWANDIKVPTDRIVKLGDKSNFWPSNARLNGPNGPCGPCSEIFYDYGVNPKCPNGQACDPDCSCGRFSEVWNLVFTQFNRKDGGVLEPLPAKNIDTGMGLERLAAVVQGKKSNYETDNFAAILKVIKDAFIANGVKATESEFRIIADHMRAVTVGIADGVMPSNEGRGYVMRKLIVDMSDLAIRAGIQKPVIYSFVDIVIDRLKDPYPELSGKTNEIKEIVKRGEEAFIKVRRERLPELKERLIANKENVTNLGEILFLYRDTYGLPLPTISTVAIASGVSPAIQEQALEIFKIKMEEQRNRSRASSKMTGDVYANQDLATDIRKTEFLGYKESKAEANVLNIGPTVDERSTIVLNRTPFYAESGGQVGDTGILVGPNGKVKVVDTKKFNDIYVHYGVIEGEVKVGDKVQAIVDEPRRQAIKRNHTATHLLQAALRETLGTHIKQQGSLVDKERLRFDFTHPLGIKPEEMKKIENRLNEFINRKDPVTTEVLALEEAKKKGALAFFAEKYGQTVRVVSIGDYSREFCGGTHVTSTGEIEAMKIVSEGSVAQGIRRVEAVTGKIKVEDLLKKKQQDLAALEEVQRMKQDEKSKQIAYFEKLKSSVDEIIEAGETIGTVKLVVCSFESIDNALLRKFSDLLKQKVKSGIFILGSKGTDYASIVIAITDNLVASGIRANDHIGPITILLGGSGGGSPSLAQAGSKHPEKLHTALEELRALVGAGLGRST
jgi:alanyl-tRNA synthetase